MNQATNGGAQMDGDAGATQVEPEADTDFPLTDAGTHPDHRKWTSDKVVELLAAKFPAPEFMFVTEFGFSDDENGGSRFADGVSYCNVPSWGHKVEGYEVKVSRSDWLSELKDPTKAEATIRNVDRFWVVAPKGVVKDEAEVPEKWGWMVAYQNRLVVKKQAPPLREGNLPWTDDRVARFFRKSLRENAVRARREGYKEGQEHVRKAGMDAKASLENLQDVCNALNERVGVHLIDPHGTRGKAWLDEANVLRVRAALSMGAAELINHADDLRTKARLARESVAKFSDEVEKQANILMETAREARTGTLVLLRQEGIEKCWAMLDEAARIALVSHVLPERVKAETDIPGLVRWSSWANLPLAAVYPLKKLTNEQAALVVSQS